MAKPSCLYYLFDSIERENVKIYGFRTKPDYDQCAEFLVFRGGQFNWLDEKQFEPYREGYDLH